MRVTANYNFMQQAVLYNKGMGPACYTFDSPTKKDEKKTANNLVVLNLCILSLSLSSRAGVNYTFFLLAYARAKRAVKLVNKGLLGVSFVLFLCPYLNRNIEKLSTK